MRHLRIGAALLVVGLLALLLAAAWLLHELGRPLNADGVPQVVRVDSGRTLAQVREELIAHGVLAPRAPLLLWARLTGRDRRIQPGEYELSSAMTPREILDLLVHGRRILRRVTIPEGWDLQRILEQLSLELEIPAESLAAAATDTTWLRGMELPVTNLEGYLFPDTYRFDRAPAARSALATILATGRTRFDARRRERADTLGWSRHEVLTLASIVEAEALLGEERPRIAAVYYNRLQRGWLLQADPTVAYGLGKPAGQLTLHDLEVDTPYNTYVRPGLPPGPICSPGLASIDAVLWPLEGCQDLYFVARGDGTHIFSRTLEAHNRARNAAERNR